MSDELPQGWASVALGELTKPSRPRCLPKENPHLPFVGMEQVESQTRRLLGTLSSSEMKSTAFHFQPGDVLYGRLRPYLNKVHCADLEGLCSSEFIVMPPTGSFEAKYLAYYLSNDEFVSFANQLNQGDRPRVSFEQIAEHQIPLAPLAEQRRIVAKLKKLLGQVDTCQQRLVKMPALLKRFRQSVLAAACSGRLTADWRKENPIDQTIEATVGKIRRRREAEAKTDSQKKKLQEIFSVSEETDSGELPDNWRFIALNKLCSSFDYGTSAKSQPSGKIPVLRMGNIQAGKIDWEDLAYTTDADEIESYSLKPNTVLFNRTNSPELVGKTALYRGERPAIFAGYLIRVNPFPELDPEYLNFCLNTNYAKEFCLRVRTDGVSQSNINAQKLAAFELPFCALREQQQIVRRVESLFALADQLEARLAKARGQVDKLTPSLLARAFAGKLVPQDPNDEPAEKLLERIHKAQTD